MVKLFQINKYSVLKTGQNKKIKTPQYKLEEFSFYGLTQTNII